MDKQGLDSNAPGPGLGLEKNSYPGTRSRLKVESHPRAGPGARQRFKPPARTRTQISVPCRSLQYCTLMTYLSPSLWALRTPCRSYQETISWLYQWKVYLLIFPFFAGHLFCHYLDAADWEIVNMINSSYSGIKNAWNECAERIQIKHVKQFCGRFSELVLSHNLLASKPHLEAYVLTQCNSMGCWGYKLVCFTTRSKKNTKRDKHNKKHNQQGMKQRLWFHGFCWKLMSTVESTVSSYVPSLNALR